MAEVHDVVFGVDLCYTFVRKLLISKQSIGLLIQITFPFTDHLAEASFKLKDYSVRYKMIYSKILSISLYSSTGLKRFGAMLGMVHHCLIVSSYLRIVSKHLDTKIIWFRSTDPQILMRPLSLSLCYQPRR